MTDHRAAVQEAHAIYKRRAKLTPAKRDEAILALVRHAIWSNTNIRDITGASHWFIRKLSPKDTREGGRLNPETLGDIVEVIRQKDRGELDRTLLSSILERGTSVYVLSTLTGYAVTNLKRWTGRDKRRDAA